ncbi:hypothetical protein FB45DRAFT_892391 [Roridomyces roridus]|uniref:Uncharacterized protein n=1 Tax=Roridomyces roridus TaxID=1738132 RepID=A0AAD7G0A7_9AGAR|nr:hypothetical protein FB45DRAFT_892391 [Roridomyces roridus]
MVSFTQFLLNAGIPLSPAVFVAIIAGGLFLIVLLVVLIVYLHRRSKRKAKDVNKTTFTFADIAQPHPPLPPSRDTSFDPEDVLSRESRQQEQTYMQLMVDLQRPTWGPNVPPLPDQAPRQLPPHLRPPPTSNPPVTAPTPPPLVATSTAGVQTRDVALKRRMSVRSHDSTASEYSTASAPVDFQERIYQPFNLTLATVPASPATPKWPSTPGSYAWPKRTTVIRDELAPETYAKVRWLTNDDSVEPAFAPPVAHALVPAVGPVLASLRPNIMIGPPPVHRRNASDRPESAAYFYANESAAISSPTKPPPTPF